MEQKGATKTPEGRPPRPRTYQKSGAVMSVTLFYINTHNSAKYMPSFRQSYAYLYIKMRYTHNCNVFFIISWSWRPSLGGLRGTFWLHLPPFGHHLATFWAPLARRPKHDCIGAIARRCLIPTGADPDTN